MAWTRGRSSRTEPYSSEATPAIDLPSDTTYYALADHVVEEPFEFEDGSLPVPEEPGLGVTVDEDAIERVGDR